MARRRPQTLGVRAVAVDPDGRACLVRHTYQRGLYLPGGGVKRHETLEAAMHRELSEEVGITGASLRVVGAYSSQGEGKRDHVVVFEASRWRRAAVSSGEIAETLFVATDDLPDDATPATRRRLADWAASGQASLTW